MSNLAKLCASFKTVKISFRNKKIINSETQFFRLLATSRLELGSEISFFIQTDDRNGSRRRITGKVGESFFTILSRHKDIVGDNYGFCKGSTLCSTCHIKFPKEVFVKLPHPIGQEELILDMMPTSDLQASRLACAVELTSDMNGITIIVPMQRLDVRKL